MICRKKFKMSSKKAFLLLAIYFIAMNDLGSSLDCYQDCYPDSKNCKNGTKVTCYANETHCATITTPRTPETRNTLGHRCLGDNQYQQCVDDPYCDPCKEDLCNKPKAAKNERKPKTIAKPKDKKKHN